MRKFPILTMDAATQGFANFRKLIYIGTKLDKAPGNINSGDQGLKGVTYVEAMDNRSIFPPNHGQGCLK